MRFGRDLRRNAAEQRPLERHLSGADQNMRNPIRVGKVEDGLAGRQCFDHMNGELAGLCQSERFGPMSKCGKPLHMLVVALRVEGRIERDQIELENIEAGKVYA